MVQFSSVENDEDKNVKMTSRKGDVCEEY